MVFWLERAATKQDGGLPLLTFKVVERNKKKIYIYWLHTVRKENENGDSYVYEWNTRQRITIEHNVANANQADLIRDSIAANKSFSAL